MLYHCHTTLFFSKFFFTLVLYSWTGVPARRIWQICDKAGIIFQVIPDNWTTPIKPARTNGPKPLPKFIGFTVQSTGHREQSAQDETNKSEVTLFRELPITIRSTALWMPTCNTKLSTSLCNALEHVEHVEIAGQIYIFWYIFIPLINTSRGSMASMEVHNGNSQVSGKGIKMDSVWYPMLPEIFFYCYYSWY